MIKRWPEIYQQKKVVRNPECFHIKNWTVALLKTKRVIYRKVTEITALTIFLKKAQSPFLYFLYEDSPDLFIYGGGVSYYLNWKKIVFKPTRYKNQFIYSGTPG